MKGLKQVKFVGQDGETQLFDMTYGMKQRNKEIQMKSAPVW